MQKLNYVDYASATAIALVMLIIAFAMPVFHQYDSALAGPARSIEEGEL